MDATTVTELNRIIDAKRIIKEKLLELNVFTDSEARIDDCAMAINEIENLGNIELVFDSEMVADYTVPSGYTSGVHISVTQITHYYYNNLRLPKIPPDAIETYPYCWIRDNNSTGYYDLIMGTTSFYYDEPNSRLRRRGSDVDLWYRIPKSTANTAISWGSPQSHNYVGWTIDSNRPVFWTNYDVTQSESSTEIYFSGSEPIPEISGQELMSMIEGVL